MKKLLAWLGVGLVVFLVCFLLVWNIGKAVASTVRGLQPLVLLCSVLIALAMTVFVMVEIRRLGRK